MHILCNVVHKYNPPPVVTGKMISQMFTLPSEEVEAKIASVEENIIPDMHVTPFLCGCGTVNTCLHWTDKQSYT